MAVTSGRVLVLWSLKKERKETEEEEGGSLRLRCTCGKGAELWHIWSTLVVLFSRFQTCKKQKEEQIRVYMFLQHSIKDSILKTRL